MKQPTEGGRYNRDPETGELTKVTEAITENAAPAIDQPVATETEQAPETGKKGK